MPSTCARGGRPLPRKSLTCRDLRMNNKSLVVVEVRVSLVELGDVLVLTRCVFVILGNDCIVCDLTLAKSLNNFTITKASLFVNDSVFRPID